MLEDDEGDMLNLDALRPPRSNEHLDLLLTYDEPSLNAPNSQLRVLEEVVQGKFEGSPQSNVQISKGNEKKRISKFKTDLFEWLILFQPNNESRRGGNYLN